jgi:predicted nucleotidyltransferase
VGSPMKLSKEVKKKLDKMVKKIVQAYKPEKIILFGSYAYGDPNRDSDLDLLIIKETDEIPFPR